jgi:hypothetical protein
MLGVYVHDAGAGLSTSIQYSPALVERSAARNLLEDVLYAVRGLVATPERRTSEYSQLSQRYSGVSVSSTTEMAEFVVLGSDLIPALRFQEASGTDD